MSNVKADLKITLKIKGKTITLNKEEAEALREVLNELLNNGNTEFHYHYHYDEYRPWKITWDWYENGTLPIGETYQQEEM